ncbi:MAG TPA: hypothetical protein VK148_19345 [Xanthobacteraceae bacterium]|nr:hypothetical protein [Xanthobacteraceae bacterium]
MNTAIGSYVYTVLLPSRSAVSAVKMARPHWWRLTSALSDPYRPELYYMRGPGPKWREKHALGAGKTEH